MIPLWAASAARWIRRIPWQVWAALAVLLACWWLYRSGYNAGREDCQTAQAAAVSEARQQRIEHYEAEIARVKAADAKTAADTAALAGRLESAEAAYAALLERIPTKPLVIYETVPGSECPAGRLSADFRLRVNEAVTGSPAR